MQNKILLHYFINDTFTKVLLKCQTAFSVSEFESRPTPSITYPSPSKKPPVAEYGIEV